MIHILIRYLGIKTKLLENIKEVVEDFSGCNKTILDLFAGSNVVGQFLAEGRNIYSNDIQKYSYVVAKATLDINKEHNYTCLNIDKIFQSKYYKKNYDRIFKIFKSPLTYERDLLEKCKNETNYNNLKELEILYNNTPYTNNFNENVECFSGLKDYYTENYYNNLKIEDQYMLFTLNYAMPYFTLNQAVEIDSLRCAIELLYRNKEINETEYYVYLSLLIYALQNIVTSIGDHFAQPQILKISEEKKYKKEVDKILYKKTLKIYDLMFAKQEEFKNIDVKKYGENKCFNLDAKKLLENETIMNHVDIIYMDPPYTNAHYSRFYHILETLINYNYPKLEFNGRYSEERYQSPYCIKTKASKEFENLIEICSIKNKKLIISYSDTSQCIIDYETMKEICNRYYKKVKINKIDYLYRNLGQKPNKVKGNELLIICE